MAIAIALDKQSHLQKTQKKVWAIRELAIPFFVPYLKQRIGSMSEDHIS
jgi:hypothetical protein